MGRLLILTLAALVASAPAFADMSPAMIECRSLRPESSWLAMFDDPN